MNLGQKFLSHATPQLTQAYAYFVLNRSLKKLLKTKFGYELAQSDSVFVKPKTKGFDVLFKTSNRQLKTSLRILIEEITEQFHQDCHKDRLLSKVSEVNFKLV